jgi:hypothetical protein
MLEEDKTIHQALMSASSSSDGVGFNGEDMVRMLNDDSYVDVSRPENKVVKRVILTCQKSETTLAQ